MPFDKTQLMRVPTLASGGVAALGWFLQFIGIAIAGGQGVIGFELFYLLVVILGVLALIGFHQTKEHRIAIVAFVAIGFNFLVGLTDSALQVTKATSFFGTSSQSSAYGCIAAGSIFQSFVFIYWIVLFGSGETSPVTVLVEQQGQAGTGGAGFNLPSISIPKFGGNKERGIPSEQITVAASNQSYTTASPAPAAYPNYPPPAVLGSTPSPPPAAVVVGQARALHAYTANPSDPKELSFAKGQVLEILDMSGKWWAARYTDVDGSVRVGIVPSNYVQAI
ncbi:UNVERIFIED_CONTAM: Transmembrane osmosensor [Siphonaria sp. JEL0065]|nr:Transmembrane osmosensor [Siphonaria sp. JEL0065]